MKNRMTFCIILIVMSSFCFGQKQRISCPKPNPNAVRSSQMRIYVLNGIIEGLSNNEIEFGKKYNVTYHMFGCLAPANLEYYEELNQKVFDLLNIQFGPKWQDEIKPTILGFSKWKENNK
jgi:hypothetical protein